MDLVVLSGDEWRNLLAAAAELDLVHGGYFRARTRMIQFYCGPENAPEGWPSGFPDGTPETPRALVGHAEVTGPAGEETIEIRLTVSNWTAAQNVKQAFDRGEYRGRFQEFVLAQEGALRGRSEDRAWLRRQFQKLREHVSGSLLDA